MYQERFYRSWAKDTGLVTFEVIEWQTDILVSCDKDLRGQTRAVVLNYRKDLEEYIERDPSFLGALTPVEALPGAPDIVKAMIEAGCGAGVGPMAAVAGAVAEFVGRELMRSSREVIVENGGDIFVRSSRARVIGIYAGDSSLSGKIALEVAPREEGWGVCTSSGTVSHSLSFGRADAVLIISDDAALADAAATATGNIVQSPADIEKALLVAKSIDGVRGAIVIVQDRMGSWGDIKLV